MLSPLKVAVTVLCATVAVPVWAQTPQENPAPTRQVLDLTLDTGSAAAPSRPTAAPPKTTPAPKAPTRTAKKGSFVRPERGSLMSRGGGAARQAPLPAPKTLARLGVVQVDEARLYVRMDASSNMLSAVPKGTQLALISEAGNWWGVLMANKTVGWVSKDAVEQLDYQAEVDVPQDPATAETTTAPRFENASQYLDGIPADTDPRAIGAIREAFTYLGVPYVWGGNTRSGLDCSAFVRNVFSTQGVSLPRHSGDQTVKGRLIQGPDLRAGDRLYFDCSTKHGGIDHTGIYLGNGLFIHASGGQHKVVVESLFKQLYYNGLVAARRDFE